RTHWETFTTEVKSTGLDFTSLSTPAEIDRAAENLNTSFQSAIDKAVPSRKNTTRKLRAWWTPELSAEHCLVKEAEERSRNEPTNAALKEELRKIRNKWRNKVRYFKQRHTNEILRQVD